MSRDHGSAYANRVCRSSTNPLDAIRALSPNALSLSTWYVCSACRHTPFAWAQLPGSPMGAPIHAWRISLPTFTYVCRLMYAHTSQIVAKRTSIIDSPLSYAGPTRATPRSLPTAGMHTRSTEREDRPPARTDARRRAMLACHASSIFSIDIAVYMSLTSAIPCTKLGSAAGSPVSRRSSAVTRA